jgi:hypothetical protein
MKLTVIALALAATTFAANAQTTVITQERAPAVVVQPDTQTTVQTKERTGILGTDSKTTTTTTGSGATGDCTNKTVHKEGLTGDKTVSKTTCD